MISDDIARHLERGARLVRLFTELGIFSHFFVLLTLHHCKYFPTAALPYMLFQ
jgi:hypothetical protein